METRAVELQPIQGERLSQMLKGQDVCRRNPRKIFQVTEQKKEKPKLECPVCGGPHRIWHCDKLRGECAKVRTAIVKDLKMCFKCLMKHQFNECNASNCPYCDGPHNVLLCYKKENADRKKNGQNQNQNFPQDQKKHPPPREKSKENQSKNKEEEDWND